MKLFEQIDPTIRRDTRYMIMVVAVLTTMMEAVFLIIGKWDITVLWGGLLGACASILNFFLMGLTVQKAVAKEKKDAQALMKASQALRMLMLIVFCVIGASLSCFNLVSVLIPLLFPSIGAKLHGVIVKS